MNATDIILAVLGSSAVTTLVGYVINRKKNKSEAEKIKAEAYNIFSDTYTELIGALRAELKSSREEMSSMRAQISSLLNDKDDSRSRIQDLERVNKLLQSQISNL